MSEYPYRVTRHKRYSPHAPTKELFVRFVQQRVALWDVWNNYCGVILPGSIRHAVVKHLCLFSVAGGCVGCTVHAHTGIYSRLFLYKIYTRYTHLWPNKNNIKSKAVQCLAYVFN